MIAIHSEMFWKKSYGVWFVVEGFWDWINSTNKQNLRSWYHRASWRSRNALNQEPSCCINNNLCFICVFIWFMEVCLHGKERLRISITPVCLASSEGLGWRIMGNVVFTVLFYVVVIFLFIYLCYKL